MATFGRGVAQLAGAPKFDERKLMKVRPAFGAVAAALLLATGTTVMATPVATAAGSFHGCPYGAVCVYPGANLSTGPEPGGIYWRYGSHNLNNQFGEHAVINNQYGGAWMYLCYGYNGTGGWSVGEAPNIAYPPYTHDLTPINSIVLTPGPDPEPCGGPGYRP
jgi:hypothetical protein